MSEQIPKETKHALKKCIHQMSIGIDAVDGLSRVLPDALEHETLDPDQVAGLLKTAVFSLLTTQRKLIYLIDGK